MLIEDTGSYQRFFRSDWFVSKELVEQFINKVRPEWMKVSNYEIEIEEMLVQEQVGNIGDARSYEAYHEFDSE